MSETTSDPRPIARRYCGSTPLRRRRGRATTVRGRLFAIIAQAAPRADAVKIVEKMGVRDSIALDLGKDAYAGVPCWNKDEHWITWAVPIAYAQHYNQIRHLIGAHSTKHRKDDISLTTLIKIAAAHAIHADFRTGRNCRPTLDRLIEITGYGERTIQRARHVLRLIGVATEIVRGRQRTLPERLASHRVGSRARGWASVYALHSPQLVDKTARHNLAAPHPEGHPLGCLSPLGNYSLTPTACGGELKGHAARDRATDKRRWTGPPPDQKGLLLASRWRQDPHTPTWGRRYTPAAWSHVLAQPAAHDWTSRDLNQLLRDYTLPGNGNWIAHNPHKPIALLAGILNHHGDLQNRPAAIDDAREAEVTHQRQTQLACERCDDQGWLLPYTDVGTRCGH
ncbi:helix-turn-helix domain-containing protein [Williamsia sp. 1135]|uniref:helix-turn-helix domain-containing protein n=1 Tax=Williamsia sp. 1135 TaxID=1889262 RepID=UPI00117F8824|nr:helix-turn-helix domain-containing protein [Williamsia sp. 1135]